MSPPLVLLASSDDYLLEEALRDAVAAACQELAVASAELLPDGVTAESVALEVATPSLFSPARVLVVRDARAWVKASPPAGGRVDRTEDPAGPLVRTLEEGLPEGVALVMAAWCGDRPKGDLVELVERGGHFTWIPLPAPPKPWEETTLSDEQKALLRTVLRRALPAARFTAGAEDLLLERLGFAPRSLVQEAGKLATAAGPGGEVDEALVRRLALPRERSLEAVRDAVLKRDASTLLDLVAAAAAGIPITGWQGRRLDQDSLGPALLGQVAGLLEQLLDLRLLALELGLAAELNPRGTQSGAWYRNAFQPRIAPVLLERLAGEHGSPLLKKHGKAPSPFVLRGLFVAAGRYREEELVKALAEAGEVEVGLRGALPLEALSAWLARLTSTPSAG